MYITRSKINEILRKMDIEGAEIDDLTLDTMDISDRTRNFLASKCNISNTTLSDLINNIPEYQFNGHINHIVLHESKKIRDLKVLREHFRQLKKISK